MITSRTANDLFTNVALQELKRLGIEQVFIAPGSRSTPLVLAAEQQELECHVHFDERGLGFMALGASKASGKPTIIVTTSGTAVANLLPAIVEASQSHTPLILLTADRPFELRNCGANQSIEQTQIFSKFVRFSIDLPVPGSHFPLESLLTTINEAVQKALSPNPGPVQLNFTFQEPLVPTEGTEYEFSKSNWFSSKKPYIEKQNTEQRVQLSDELLDLIRNAKNPLMTTSLPLEGLQNWTHHLNWPILADTTTVERFSAHENLISHHEHLFDHPCFNEIDLVIQIGNVFTSKHGLAFFKNYNGPKIQINPYPQRSDPFHKSIFLVQSNPTEFLNSLRDSNIYSKSNLLGPLQTLNQKVAHAIHTYFESSQILNEPFVSYALTKYVDSATLFFVGSSRPIRDFEKFGVVNNNIKSFYSNRGASGIDGNIATLAGLAKNINCPIRALIGDLAALHDLNSIPLLKDSKYPITLVINNNDGGGIFSFLPVKNQKHFEKYWGTPHGFHFKEFCKGFGIQYLNPKSRKEFLEALTSKDHLKIIEVTSERNQNFKHHEEFNTIVRCT